MNSIEKDYRKTASLTALLDLEYQLGIDLPQDYRQFLLENNGGMPINRDYDFTNANGDRDSSDVLCFFALESKIPSIDLIIDRVDFFKDIIMPCFIPIGEDSGGDLLLLHKKDGSIYFFDHEFEKEKPDLSNCYCLANSFDEFFHQTLYLVKQ